MKDLSKVDMEDIAKEWERVLSCGLSGSEKPKEKPQLLAKPVLPDNSQK